MRAVRVGLVAVLAFVLSLGSAQAGIFDCLKGQTITIPPIQFSPVQSAPIFVQSQAPQSGLIDSLLLELLKGFIGGVNKPPTTDNSGSLQRANATLDRIDGKMDRLEVLIVDRLAKVESDVATVAKAQKESTAQLEQRLVETMNFAKENREFIKTNSEAILANRQSIMATQLETALLLKGQAPKAVKLTQDIMVTPIPTAAQVKILTTTDVEVLGEVTDANNMKWEIIRWEKKSKIGTAKAGDAH